MDPSITASATDGPREAVPPSAGAQGYIGKPFDPGELTATLRAAIKNSGV